MSVVFCVIFLTSSLVFLAVREHKDTVLTCLDDEDESIRLRALDLLTGMVDKKVSFLLL